MEYVIAVSAEGGQATTAYRRRRLWGVLAIALLIALTALLAWNAMRASAAQKFAQFWERHTLEVVIETQRLLAGLEAAESGQHGYLLSGSAADLARSTRGAAAATAQLDIVRNLTQDNTAQQANVAALGSLIDQLQALLVATLAAHHPGRDYAEGIDPTISRGDGVMTAARSAVQQVLAEEDRPLAQRRDISERTAARAQQYIAGLSAIGIGLVGLIVVLGFSAWRASDRLRLATQARHAAEQVRLSQADAARVAAIIAAVGEATPDMIFAKDREGRMLFANRKTLAVIGKSAAQVIGRRDSEWTATKHEGEFIEAIDQRVMAKGITEVVDEPFTGPDGVQRIYRSTKSPIRDATGLIVGLAGVTMDPTGERNAAATLRASEERFRTLSATLPGFIFVTSAEGANTFTNPVFQQFTGKTSDDLLGDGWLSTLHPEDCDRAARTWATAWQTKRGYEAEYRFHHHADGYRWFLVRGTPVRDAESKSTQWVGVCTDMQEIIDARTALETTNADLETRVVARTTELQHALDTLGREIAQREASEAQVRQLQKIEAVGQLTGGIAHDFNNMLAIIVGSLDMAKRRLVTNPARALAGIEHAEEGAQRAAQLTSRLMAFSRQQALAPEILDPNKLVANMSELLRRTIGEAIKTETVLAGGIWRTLIDPGQLENALLNLCVNARDAMPSGGNLTIETGNGHLDDAYAATSAGVEPGQYVVIAVTDTGTGMPASVIERAFDPFYTTKGVGKGTGLGLSQVYGFVKQSNGQVKIYSEPGQGTTVKLYLPRHFGAATEHQRLTETLGDIPRARDGEAVLVVEDEAAVRLMSVDVLENLGYQVIAATNGAQALDLLERHPEVTLLFTDIVMPEMSGRALADRALALRPTLKVLFTTGYTRNAVVHNGMLDPGVAFLPKPFGVDALARKIQAVFNNGGINRPG